MISASEEAGLVHLVDNAREGISTPATAAAAAAGPWAPYAAGPFRGTDSWRPTS